MNQMAPLATEEGYNFAFLDEQTKRMIRRAVLKAAGLHGLSAVNRPGFLGGCVT